MTEKQLVQHMRNFEFPFYVRIMTRAWFLCLRWLFIASFFSIFILSFWYNSYDTWTPSSDALWNLMVAIVLTNVGVGVAMIVSQVWKYLIIKRECKRLGIDVSWWNHIAEKYNITI